MSQPEVQPQNQDNQQNISNNNSGASSAPNENSEQATALRNWRRNIFIGSTGFLTAAGFALPLGIAHYIQKLPIFEDYTGAICITGALATAGLFRSFKKKKDNVEEEEDEFIKNNQENIKKAKIFGMFASIGCMLSPIIGFINPSINKIFAITGFVAAGANALYCLIRGTSKYRIS